MKRLVLAIVGVQYLAALAITDEEYHAHSVRARATVEAHYRWPKVAEATLALYGLP